jgi:hypothetical protein
MLSALLLAAIDQLTKFEINSFEVWIAIVITGGSLLGITLFEGKIKGKSNNAVMTVDPDKDKTPDVKG